MFDVYLLLQPPDGFAADGIAEDLKDQTSFPIEIEDRDDGLVGVWCRGIKVAGNATVPEALRIAQAGLSVPLKRTYPAYAERGGLLWRDVLQARIHANS